MNREPLPSMVLPVRLSSRIESVMWYSRLAGKLTVGWAQEAMASAMATWLSAGSTLHTEVAVVVVVVEVVGVVLPPSMLMAML